MAVQTDVSSPTSGTAAVYSLLTQLCTAGWLVKAWSDATTYTGGVSLSANPYSGSGSGAGNLGNTSAWFRVAAPDASREWLFQRGAADQTWTISRSNAGFVGGTPNATTAGTATDATALFSAAQAFPTTTWRQFLSIEDASPYGFTVFGITLGGGNVLTFLADEPLRDPAAEDTDPCLWLGYWNGTGLAATGAFAVSSNSAVLGYKRYTAAGSNQRIAYGVLYDLSALAVIAPAQNTTTGQLGQTPSGAKEVPFEIPVTRNAAAATSSGYAGYARRHRYCTVGGRSNGQTLANGTSDYWIYAAGLWVPWDNTTPALS